VRKPRSGHLFTPTREPRGKRIATQVGHALQRPLDPVAESVRNRLTAGGTGFEPSVPPWKGRVSRRADRDRLSRPAWPTVKRTVGLPVRIRFPPAVSQANFKQVGTNLRPRSTATTSTGRFAPPGFEPQSSNCFSAPKRAVSWVGLEGRAKDAVFYCRAALST